jgi:hypothetical protein
MKQKEKEKHRYNKEKSMWDVYVLIICIYTECKNKEEVPNHTKIYLTMNRFRWFNGFE